MGRTADNDVVIKDASSSRSHARVYEEDGLVFVEDLQSANGTTLNDRPLKAPVQLEAGDLIAIGDVVLEFVSAAGPSSTLEGEDDDDAPLVKPRSKPAVAAVAKPAALRKPTDPGRQAIEPTAPRGAALGKPSKGVPVTAPELVVENQAPLLPTAAFRARERRELQRSNVGKLQVLWQEFPKPTRIALGIIGSLVIVGMLGGLISAMIPRRPFKRNEPAELVPNGVPIVESFGEGDGIDFSRPDMKTFTFTFAAPTAIVGVLHYQARDCGKDEVSIELNGTQLGSVPADTVDVDNRQLEVVLPTGQMKVNEPNEVVFDNVTNPPANDPWRLWNLWVEVIPVPRMTAEEAGRRAKEDLERAARLYELRGVGAMNLFHAWKQYREAWLLLEATPGRPDELLQHARARMKEIRPELDKMCSLMLVSYQREMNHKNPNIAAARQMLEDIPSHFEKEHPCYSTSRGLIANLEDLGVLD